MLTGPVQSRGVLETGHRISSRCRGEPTVTGTTDGWEVPRAVLVHVDTDIGGHPDDVAALAVVVELSRPMADRDGGIGGP